jgi:hypothetical protein
MNEQLVISYNWIIQGDIVNQENEVVETYEINTIGSDYMEAKDIAMYLLKKKGLRLIQVRSAKPTGIKFAYYEDSKENVPVSAYPNFPAPLIPKIL